MSCSTPNLLIWHGDYNSSGRKNYRFMGRLHGSVSDYESIGVERVLVPCGHCPGCQLDKSRVWADRMLLELDHSKTAVFVTLTYNDYHLPVSGFDSAGDPVGTLNKRDYQLFMKRLRKQFPNRSIRYVLCGEYGSLTLRPHYHAILFGLSLDDFKDFRPWKTNNNGQCIYISFMLSSIWQNGFTSISDVSWHTFAYVARYTLKKRYALSASWYSERGVVPEFIACSRRPGIGMYYPSEHPECCAGADRVCLTDGYELKKFALPSKILELAISDSDVYNHIREQRQALAASQSDFILSHTDLSQSDYLVSVSYDAVSKSNYLRGVSNVEI